MGYQYYRLKEKVRLKGKGKWAAQDREVGQAVKPRFSDWSPFLMKRFSGWLFNFKYFILFVK